MFQEFYELTLGAPDHCEHNNDTNTLITNSTIIIITIASITTSTVIQTMTTIAITII